MPKNSILKKLSVQKTYIDIDGQAIPAKIYRERRKGSRASVGKKAVILRMPSSFNKQQQEQSYQWFKDWLIKVFQENEHLIQRFVGKEYKSGDVLKVGQRTYTLNICFEDRKHHQGKLKDGIIFLQLSQKDKGPSLSKAIRHLLSRLVAQDFKPAITRRVLELNDEHFKKNIKSVNLKYNLSNWGSCSSKRNLNLSTRLLFAPDSVIDYVIIHELAHLIEMNHSPQFWKLVETAMPNYKNQERWLKENRQLCDF